MLQEFRASSKHGGDFALQAYDVSQNIHKSDKTAEAE